MATLGLVLESIVTTAHSHVSSIPPSVFMYLLVRAIICGKVVKVSCAMLRLISICFFASTVSSAAFCCLACVFVSITSFLQELKLRAANAKAPISILFLVFTIVLIC